MGTEKVSALPLPDNVFKLPKRRPKIVEKAAPPDQRSHAVLPIRAVTDKRLTDGQFRALALLCSFCNRAGITWVSQKRLAADLQVSQQAISKHMRALTQLGYIEVTRRGFRGEKPNTTRVIFDPTISMEDAIAATSSIEDTRPPEVKREEVKAMAEPEFSEEQLAANKQRLRELLTGFAPKNHTTHGLQSIGDVMGTTRKPRPKKASHSQPNTVVNAEAVHSQPHTQPNEVVQNTKNIGIGEVLSLYEEIIKRRFMVSVCTTEQDLKAAEIMCEVGVTASDIDAALSEQRNLVEVADRILNARVSR